MAKPTKNISNIENKLVLDRLKNLSIVWIGMDYNSSSYSLEALKVRFEMKPIMLIRGDNVSTIKTICSKK